MLRVAAASMQAGAQSLVQSAERIEAALLPVTRRAARPRPANAAASDRPAADGEIRDGRIFVDGKWLHLTRRLRKLLAIVMRDEAGVSVESACTETTWDTATLEARVRELSRELKKEMKGSARWPYVFFKDGVRWEWHPKRGKEKKAV